VHRLLAPLTLLLLAALLAVPGPTLAAAHPDARHRTLRITGVRTDCECGGAYMSSANAVWGATSIRFHAPSTAANHQYRLSIHPRIKVPKRWLRMRAYVHSTWFGLMHGRHDFKRGRRYTLQVRELVHGRVVRTSRKLHWTPRVVGHPKAHLNADWSGDWPVVQAGSTYHIRFDHGRFETGTKVYIQVLAQPMSGGGYPADAEILIKAYRQPRDVAFTVPSWAGGDALTVDIVAEKRRRLAKGWDFGGPIPING
jgi:hypothetical protein